MSRMTIWRGSTASPTTLDDAVLYAPLTHSLVLTRGTGSPSFTRATTETGQKWDEAGYLDFTALAGEAVFKGARRERNLIANSSENVTTSAFWFADSGATSTASTVTFTASASSRLRNLFTMPGGTASKVVVGSFKLSVDSGTKLVRINLSHQGVDAVSSSDFTVTTTPTVFQFSKTNTSGAGDGTFTCGLINGTDAAAGTVNVHYAQCEDVTGQTTQTASEYVSVGAPNDWAGPELVTNGTFDTATTGWAARNTATLSVVSGRLRITNGSFGGAEQAVSTVPGTKYVLARNFTAGTTTACITQIGTTNGNNDIYAGGIVSDAYLAVEFTAVGATTYIQFFLGDGVASNYADFDNISVKPAIYHGSMVDGVKCYDTDRSGNPISTSGSYPLVGYVPWEARTNLCLQSNAFTTTWAALSTPSITQNVIGPDGATSAWTITDDSAVAREGIYQSVALTATTHTFSIFVKKTTGVQTNYPVLFMFPALTSLAAVTIDTTNGVATPWTAYTGFSGVSCSATCVNHNANYWRVAVTFTGTAAAWEIDIYPAATSNPTQSTGTIDVTAQGSAVFYGAQVELGSFATPYIPTTTVAVARNADVDQYPTTDGPIAAAGSIALDFTPYHAPSGTIALWGTYVDASNYTAILHDATNLIFRKRIAGSNYDATIANAFVSGTTCKIAATWGAAGTAIYLNGVAGTPHANTTAAQIAATMQFGADGNSLQQPGAAVIKNYIWQRQLSGSEQAAITA